MLLCSKSQTEAGNILAALFSGRSPARVVAPAADLAGWDGIAA